MGFRKKTWRNDGVEGEERGERVRDVCGMIKGNKYDVWGDTLPHIATAKRFQKVIQKDIDQTCLGFPILKKDVLRGTVRPVKKTLRTQTATFTLLNVFIL